MTWLRNILETIDRIKQAGARLAASWERMAKETEETEARYVAYLGAKQAPKQLPR